MSISSANAPVGSDSWEQIATATPTSGTSVSFTSIPTGYRKLWLVTDGPITLSVGDYFVVTVNSITSTNAYRYLRYATNGHAYSDETAIYQQSSGTLMNFDLIFENSNNGNPFVTFDGTVANTGTAAQRVDGYVMSATTPITQIDITAPTANLTTNTGTIYLYGTY